MIYRRRAEIHETKTGHERWLVSYSDFITLLFGFFVVMYSVSQVSEQKYRALSDTLASAFEGHVPVTARVQKIVDQYPLDDMGEVTGLSPQINLVDTETLAKELQDVLVHLVKPADISITASEDWVEIDVNANVLFASGSADASGEAKRIFAEVGRVLAPYDNEIEVAGHTDNVPIASGRFASNWDLSAARAVSVVKLLVSHRVAQQRLSAVGYGEFRPIAANRSEAGRAQNRRVVLKVARHQAVQTFAPPMKSPADAEVPISIPTTVTPVSEASASSVDIEPVRLDNGGLLFSSDPDLPRK